MSVQENDIADQPATSNEAQLDDLDFLSFPPDIDWSTTLVIRCDPNGSPYKLNDVMNALHMVVRRNDVHNLGHTALNHVFTISFKTEWATQNFIRYYKDRRRQVLIKDHSCVILPVPTKCVTVLVRWIPVDVDTVHIVDVLKQYGTIVKSELVKFDRKGWFHVYTGERKIQIFLNEGLDVNHLPFSINVKGLIGAVLVSERNPKCLDCYHNGHNDDFCKQRGCILYREK